MKMSRVDDLPEKDRIAWLQESYSKAMPWLIEDCITAKESKRPVVIAASNQLPNYNTNDFLCTGAIVKLCHSMGVDVLFQRALYPATEYTDEDIVSYKETVIARVKADLPQMLETCDKVIENNANGGIVIHQDAFAADYQPHELYLLGCFIKYLGMREINLTIFGKPIDYSKSNKSKAKKKRGKNK